MFTWNGTKSGLSTKVIESHRTKIHSSSEERGLFCPFIPEAKEEVKDCPLHSKVCSDLDYKAAPLSCDSSIE
ncbi:hypothetical protein OS493_022528 [Desmophyllum pertusum]|uniref:Uncharacterized protein n=1 Tax=Desmophyllum pertusum TaxID=174260 RepID=A0A9W9ZB78_9CNID|nr:hypothetical protein OS493_022528 [Desmophyllum pertusum]